MQAYHKHTGGSLRSVHLLYTGSDGHLHSSHLITTTPAHAERIVRTVNSPGSGNFPAVKAAVGARARAEASR
jgi:hypothetical protein